MNTQLLLIGHLFNPLDKEPSLNAQALTLASCIRFYCKSRKEALQYAWNKVRLLKSLKQPLTYFVYKKKYTGEVVDRMGTLNEDSFDYVYKRSYMYQRWYIVKYWDLSKMAWRSLDIRNLKTIHW